MFSCNFLAIHISLQLAFGTHAVVAKICMSSFVDLPYSYTMGMSQASEDPGGSAPSFSPQVLLC